MKHLCTLEPPTPPPPAIPPKKKIAECLVDFLGLMCKKHGFRVGVGGVAGGLASLLEAVPPTLKLMFLAQVRLFGESYQTSWALSKGPWWNSWLRVRS